MLKHLLRSPASRAVLVFLLTRYLKLALGTTRWTVLGAEHLAPLLAGQPVIGAFWHERLPLMPALWDVIRRGATRPAQAHVLVSRHSDGRVIGDIMRAFSVEPIFGSSARGGRDRGGAAGIRAMLRALAEGGHIVITPDGPRGPRREAAPGVAQLAALSGIAVLPCAAQINRRWTLGSWDRMALPLPWGRGTIVCGPPIAVPRHDWQASLPDIAAAMTRAADEADKATG